MSRETSGGSKRKVAAAAAVVTAVLAALTGLFLRTVREQLWQQSIGTIRESTRGAVPQRWGTPALRRAGG